jgi:hypothetical protein
MVLQEAGPGMRGMSYLRCGFPACRDGRRVVHTGKHLRGYFGVRGGCGSPDLRNVPMLAQERFEEDMLWAAVKNKFFVQIVEPDSGVAAVVVEAERDDSAAFVISSVGAVMEFPVREIAPGETLETVYSVFRRSEEVHAFAAGGESACRCHGVWPFLQMDMPGFAAVAQ